MGRIDIIVKKELISDIILINLPGQYLQRDWSPALLMTGLQSQVKLDLYKLF